MREGQQNLSVSVQGSWHPLSSKLKKIKKAQREESNHHFQHDHNKSLVTKKLFSDGNVDKNWIYRHHTWQGLGNVFPMEYRLEVNEK